MADLTRRSFLKGAGATAAGLLIGDFSLLLPSQVIPKILQPFGDYRAICAYDIIADHDIVRYDVLYRNTQLHVEAVINAECKKNYISKVHKPLTTALRKELYSSRVRRKDLITLPYPTDYKHPEWFEKVLYGKGV